jgi:lipoprotein-anchoring transpeptidase ErfK/SrfK
MLPVKASVISMNDVKETLDKTVDQANSQRLWAGYLGQRVSFGCVILSTQNAQTLYNWAKVGTAVDIVW